jgi:hypothetical protein
MAWGMGLVLLGAAMAGCWVAREAGRARAFRLDEQEADLADEPLTDDLLIERIRARIARHSEHPRGIMVTVQDGMATVSGPILAREVDAVIRSVQDVRGVRGVTNRLVVYRAPGNMPAFQQ